MADVGGDSSGRSHDRYIPSYDAPTAPIPAIRAEDGTMINPRVPRRFPIGDGEETVLVPRPDSAGSSSETGSSEPDSAGSEGLESVWLFPMAGFPGLAATDADAEADVMVDVAVDVDDGTRRGGETGSEARSGSRSAAGLSRPEAEPRAGVWFQGVEPEVDHGTVHSDPVRPYPVSGPSRYAPDSSGPGRAASGYSASGHFGADLSGPGSSEAGSRAEGAGSAASRSTVRSAGSPLVPGPPPAPFSPRVTPGPGGRSGGASARKKDGLLMRIGDIPIRVVYSIGAALLTALAVFLIFVLFSGDEPASPSRVGQAGTGAGTGAVAAPSPSATAITLPGLPAQTALRALPGTPSPVLGSVTDSRAAITYAKLGKPWAVAEIPSFSAGQQAGAAQRPSTMIASGLLPGAAPRADLKTDAEFRRAAVGAVKWTIGNHYPAGSKVAWTASQKPAVGKGWTLGYRVTYVVKGRKHTSQAALTLLDIGRRRPAMLLVTVPDTQKQLWADIAPLMASARAL